MRLSDIKFWGISLPGTERRQRFVDHLRKFQLPVHIIDAFDGFGSGLISDLHYGGPAFRLSPGHIGLNISWYTATTAALATGHDVNVFLEDDVELCKDFRTRVVRCIANAPKDWDVLYLGGKCGARIKVNEWFDKGERPYETHCVAVHKRALRRVSRASQPAWSNIDIQFQELLQPFINYYIAHRSCGEQNKDLPSAVHEHMGDYKKIDGWMDYADLYAEWAKMPEGVIVELGTWQGQSAIFMAKQLMENGSNAEFYTVDLFRGSESDPDLTKVCERLGGTMFHSFVRNMGVCRVTDRIVPLVCDSAAASGYFKDGSVDRLFIDADHTYESVCRDIKAWLRKVKPGGIMAGHDYNRPLVKRAVDDTLKPMGYKIETVPPISWQIHIGK